MSRTPLRAIASGIAGALLGALWLLVFHQADPVLHVEFDTEPPRLLRGVHAPERDDLSRLTFAWTQKDMALRLPRLDRSVDWVFDIRVRAARQDPRQNPDLAFHADGLHLATHPSPSDFEHVRVTVPARADRRRGVLLSMQSSATIVPGPSDTRTLGVMLDSMSLTPAGRSLPPAESVRAAAIAGAALAIAAALLNVSTIFGAAATVLLSAVAASQLARGFGLHTGYPDTAVAVTCAVAAALGVLALAIEGLLRRPPHTTAKFALAFTAGALALKLLIVLHPDMPIGDAMFHAHRFQGVLGGHLYFTSIAPGGYLFPYPPGLYVFAGAFASLVPRGPADMTLLRAVTLAWDAAAALLLYAVVTRAWNARLTAAIAVAIFQLLPLAFAVVTTGNLTNAFAQSLAIVALALLADRVTSRPRPWALALLSFVLTAAFLSHTGTFAILGVTAALTGAVFWWKGDPETRSAGAAILAATILAGVAAVAIYYAHFIETYRSELARIASETAANAPDAGGRDVMTRLRTVPFYLRISFGIPAVILLVTGIWRLWAQASRDRLTLTLTAWLAACGLFLVMGVLTPVDMRHYLAALPAVAITAALGAAYLWSRRPLGAAIALLLLGWVGWLGGRGMWTTI